MNDRHHGQRSRPPIHLGLALASTIMLAATIPIAAVAQDEAASPSDDPAAVQSEGLSYVGLGDSLPGALGCTGACRSYVQVYGELAADALGESVATSNLATNDGLESSTLLERVLTDQTHRDAVAGADIVTVQIGLNDWQGVCMWNDMATCLASNATVAEANLAAILDQVDALRDGLPTALRVVTYFDPYVGTAQAPEWWGFDPSERDAFETAFAAALTDFNSKLCGVAEDHGAVCIDTRTPFNGPEWDLEAVPEPADGALVLGGEDHLHMTAEGHQLVAQAIADTGFEPLGETAGQVASETSGDPAVAAAGAAHPGDGVHDPDGRIAFGRIVGNDDFYGLVVALYAIDPDGSDLVKLTDGESAAPVWSPDGTRIAFTQRQPDGSWQVATMAADGTDLQVLTTGAGVSEASSWSPDGTWIAYSYAPELPVDDSWHTSMYRMNADGSDPALMGDPETFDVEPQISPDGSQLTFTRLTMDDTGWHGRLLVRDIDSGEERVIDAAGDSVEHPEWSPDGEWIMYAIHPSLGAAVPQAQAERIRADGSGGPEILIAGTASQRALGPVYSPDGERIVFGCQGDEGPEAMCLADADGTDIVVLVDGPYVNHFDWGVAAE